MKEPQLRARPTKSRKEGGKHGLYLGTITMHALVFASIYQNTLERMQKFTQK